MHQSFVFVRLQNCILTYHVFRCEIISPSSNLKISHNFNTIALLNLYLYIFKLYIAILFLKKIIEFVISLTYNSTNLFLMLIIELI